jgi:hypothetical protein
MGKIELAAIGSGERGAQLLASSVGLRLHGDADEQYQENTG